MTLLQYHYIFDFAGNSFFVSVNRNRKLLAKSTPKPKGSGATKSSSKIKAAPKTTLLTRIRAKYVTHSNSHWPCLRRKLSVLNSFYVLCGKIIIIFKGRAFRLHIDLFHLMCPCYCLFRIQRFANRARQVYEGPPGTTNCSLKL